MAGRPILLDHRGQPIASRREADSRRVIKARYDAAQTTDNNRRYWANADALSADAANAPEVRARLRERSRYEVANNSYARGIVNTLAHYTIGRGPRLQVLTEDKDVNSRIERAWSRWATASRFAEKLRTLKMAQVQDGEGVGVFVNNDRLPTRVKLDIRLVESEMLATPAMWSFSSDIVDGMRLSESGNVEMYYLLKDHPGSMLGRGYGDAEPVHPDALLHYYRCDRPGQHRGIPEITPALPLFAMLRDYTLATLDAAKAAAYFAGVLESEYPGDEGDVPEPLDMLELERNLLTTLPYGTKLGQIKAEQPTGTYAEFKREILNEIARCLSVPFNIAAGNSSSYNYASGRLDHQAFFKSIEIDQHAIEAAVVDRVLVAFLEEAMFADPDVLDGAPPIAEIEHAWGWDGYEHVDPKKEADAQDTKLANFTTTLADEYAKQNKDWEVQLRQVAKELALKAELGLALSAERRSAPSGTVNEEDVEDVVADAISARG